MTHALTAAKAGFINSPQHLYPVQKQCGVLLKRSTQPVPAAAFKAYLLSPGAQAILAKLGYGAP